MKKVVIAIAAAALLAVPATASAGDGYGKLIQDATKGCSYGQLIQLAPEGHPSIAGVGAKRLYEAAAAGQHPIPDCSS